MIQLDNIDMDLVNETVGELQIQIKLRDKKLRQQLDTIRKLEGQIDAITAEWNPEDAPGLERRVTELSTRLAVAQSKEGGKEDSPVAPPPVSPVEPEQHEPVTSETAMADIADNGASGPASKRRT